MKFVNNNDCQEATKFLTKIQKRLSPSIKDRAKEFRQHYVNTCMSHLKQAVEEKVYFLKNYKYCQTTSMASCLLLLFHF